MIAIRNNIVQTSRRALAACRSKPTVFPECGYSFFSTRDDTIGRFGKYSVDFEESLSNKEKYWHDAASDLHWFKEPSLENTLQTHPKSQYMHKWFTDGLINTSYNCLDRHVIEGRGSQKALIYDSPVTNTLKHYTYADLLDEVSQFAAALTDLNVKVGDRVVIYMPNIPEAAIAMLACARIGAVHSVVFGGFAAKELASRIDHCKPKVILTASGGVLPGGKTVPYKPLVDGALEIASCGDDVEKCVVVQREGVIECTLNNARDVSYKDLINSVANKRVDAVPLPSMHEHWILYTSGTTGMPKGVVSDTGGYAVALKWSMSKFYDCEPGDVYLAASDIGWAVGHSYSVYGPLLHGCTTVLFEGKPVHPDAGVFWRAIEEHGVNVLFAAPTGFRAIRQLDRNGSLTKKYDLSTLKSVFVAGERSDPNTLHWIENILSDYKVPVIDHWWQTELSFPGAGNAKGLGFITPKHGACAAAVPGYDIKVLGDDGEELPPNTFGSLAIKLPLPPGTLPTLYNNDERYINDYLSNFPGYYDTMDAGMVDEEGYVSILSRTDDVINVSGVRLSTGAMEEILFEHADVTDCAVIGIRDDLKGDVPIGFVVVSPDRDSSKESELLDELVSLVRQKMGAVSNFKSVAVVRALPKTRSGKILRQTMRKIANGEDYVVTPTIEDPNIFDELTPFILKAAGKK
mmetsp:Transcript_4292/g.7082  ORF Transcript_4292/g.7082 Transcript_4292/m.7082 type:complete len:687 (+) Transcript_4292:107-2167(+)